jgi:two-component system OmpR family sensor kinase
MQRIEQEAARMGVLVEDLLTLARLDEEPDTRRELADLAEIARDAAGDARATAPERAIEVDAAAPALVHADADGLRQVVGNLMRNALVHTPAGTPVDVGVHADGPWVELSVRDRGPGLPTEDPDALFERFWRTEGGRERGRAGAGLGLAIVAGIVHAHGGSVTAANAPDGGAHFVVRLPAAHSQEELRVDPAASHPAAQT